MHLKLTWCGETYIFSVKLFGQTLNRKITLMCGPWFWSSHLDSLIFILLFEDIMASIYSVKQKVNIFLKPHHVHRESTIYPTIYVISFVARMGEGRGVVAMATLPVFLKCILSKFNNWSMRQRAFIEIWGEAWRVLKMRKSCLRRNRERTTDIWINC